MIIVFKPKAKLNDIKEVVRSVEDKGLSAHLVEKDDNTICWVIGDTTQIDASTIEVSLAVEKVMHVKVPYKLASRAFKEEDSIIDVAGVKVGGDNLALIAGPCSVESKEQVIEIAIAAKKAGEDVKVEVTFPEEYQAEELKGKPAVFKVTVKEIKEVELVALCDIRQERLDQYPKKRHYNDFKEMLEKEELDILDICLPTYLHADYAIMAMEKGINVICEKPISLKEEDVKRVYSTAKKNNVKFMIAQVLRFWPEYELLKEIFDTEKYLDSVVRKIPDFPKPGILFYDITGILVEPKAFKLCIDEMVARYSNMKIDAVAGIESRGFVFAAPLAERLGIPLILIRKKGKLPCETVSKTYDLEYGTATIEIHKDAIQPGQKVVLIDDLIATGGTIKAAAELVEELGGEVVKILFLMELAGLEGRKVLEGYDVDSVVVYEGK